MFALKCRVSRWNTPWSSLRAQKNSSVWSPSQNSKFFFLRCVWDQIFKSLTILLIIMDDKMEIWRVIETAQLSLRIWIRVSQIWRISCSHKFVRISCFLLLTRKANISQYFINANCHLFYIHEAHIYPRYPM